MWISFGGITEQAGYLTLCNFNLAQQTFTDIGDINSTGN